MSFNLINQSFPAQSIQQSQQEGGFWLIRLSIEHSSTLDIATRFWLQDKAQDLKIFQQTLLKGILHLALLGNQALSQPFKDLTLDCQIPTQASPIIADNKNLLLIGSDLAIANIFYLAKQRQMSKVKAVTLAMLHSKSSFPFKVKPARFMMPKMPPEVIGACPLLEDWQVSNRLSSSLGLPGCFDGEITALFAYWLEQQATENSNMQPCWQVMVCASIKIQEKCQEICQPYDWIQMISH